jgi:1-acyl-sn-glycerol-3-phosphate acyltransferase
MSIPFLALVNPQEKAPPVFSEWASYWWYDFCSKIVQWACTYAFSLRSEGQDNIPKSGPILFVANHQSFVDPLCIGVSTRRHLTFMARKTLFTNNRVFGWYLSSVNCVPVDQEGVATEGLKTTIEQLKKGKSVLIFPEGERTWKGPMQPLKPGVLLVIRRAMAPIVPVGIAGAFDAWRRTVKLPKLSPLFLPATKAAIAVSIGKPLDPQRYATLPRDQALAELFDKIHEMELKAERLRRKPS